MEECEEQLHQLALRFEDKRHQLRQASIHNIKVVVTETLQRIIEVDAYDSSDACERLETMCDEEEIVLDWNDFKTRNFEPYEDK